MFISTSHCRNKIKFPWTVWTTLRTMSHGTMFCLQTAPFPGVQTRLYGNYKVWWVQDYMWKIGVINKWLFVKINAPVNEFILVDVYKPPIQGGCPSRLWSLWRSKHENCVCCALSIMWSEYVWEVAQECYACSYEGNHAPEWIQEQQTFNLHHLCYTPRL